MTLVTALTMKNGRTWDGTNGIGRLMQKGREGWKGRKNSLLALHTYATSLRRHCTQRSRTNYSFNNTTAIKPINKRYPCQLCVPCATLHVLAFVQGRKSAKSRGPDRGPIESPPLGSFPLPSPSFSALRSMSP